MSGVERTNGEPPVGFLLYEVIRSLWPLHRTVVRAVERELIGTGMTAGQHAVIDELRRGGPRTVPQLARLLGLDRQPVQRLVNDATALGLAESAPNPEHRRSHLIRLTPKGKPPSAASRKPRKPNCGAAWSIFPQTTSRRP